MTKHRYGGAHQKERARWAPAVAAGQTYCHARTCLHPSRQIRPGAAWDLGHTPDGSTWTGPEHSTCNRSEGARRGNRARITTGRGQSRTRTCPQCFTTYRATYTEQRTCSRRCAYALRRAEAGRPETTPPAERDVQCSECDALFTTTNPKRVTCGGDCSTTRTTRLAREKYQDDPEYRARHLSAMNARNQRIRSEAVNDW